MSTESQITANRLNALKSTGPTSPEGKARSSLNALKSGIDAASQIIPGEDPAELEALTESLLLHFHPTDPVQLSLVDTLIATEWTQRRLRRIEAQLWDYQIADLLTDSERRAGIKPKSPLGRAYRNAVDAFTRIQRRIDATNRLYLRTLKALQDLQSAPAAPVSEPPSPEPPQPLTPQIGFVPQSALANYENGPPAQPVSPKTEPRPQEAVAPESIERRSISATHL